MVLSDAAPDALIVVESVWPLPAGMLLSMHDGALHLGT